MKWYHFNCVSCRLYSVSFNCLREIFIYQFVNFFFWVFHSIVFTFLLCNQSKEKWSAHNNKIHNAKIKHRCSEIKNKNSSHCENLSISQPVTPHTKIHEFNIFLWVFLFTISILCCNLKCKRFFFFLILKYPFRFGMYEKVVDRDYFFFILNACMVNVRFFVLFEKL